MKEYETQPTVDALARPVREWARSGFMRGLTGRGGIVPSGRAAMPSAAFLVAGQAEVSAAPEDGERRRREAFVEEVHGRLTAIQSEAVAEHYRMAALGRLADAGVAALAVATFLLVLDVADWKHPLTLCLLALVAGKLALAQVSIRKSVRLAEAAFSATDIPVAFPWSAKTPSVA